jgi:hypothetical protein
MADVYAVKSGNWSDTTLWNTGSLPATIDDVYANNFTVYVDGNYQVSSIRNLSATSITRGGSFILNNGISLSANVIGGGQENIFCVRFLSAAPASAFITGIISTSGSLVNVRQSYALELSGTGTLTVYGSAIGGNNNNSGTGVSDGYIQINAPGTFNIFGNIQGSLNGNVYWGINNKAAGTVNIVGNVAGRTVSVGGVTHYVIHNNSTGTINVTGNITAGVDNANVGIWNNSTGIVNVRGNVLAGTGAVTNIGASGIVNNSAGVINLIGNVQGANGNHYGINNSSTGVANITGIVLGANVNSGNGLNNAGVATIFGGAIGGRVASSAAINTGGPSSVLTVFGNISGNSGTNSFGILNASSGTIRVVGNTYGGQGTSTPGIFCNSSSTCLVFLTGNCYGVGYLPIDLSATIGGSGSHGIHIAGTNSVVVSGDVYSSNLRGDAYGIFNQNAGTVTVIGNVFGGAPTGAYGVHNNNTTSVTIISGSAKGGIGSTAYGAFNNSTGTLRVKRAVGNDWGLGYTTAFASVPGVFSNVQGSQTFVEELECGPRGQWPTGGVIFFPPNTKATSQFETDTFQNYSLIQSNSADNLLPPVSSVRQGTVYDLGTDTGTCIIPPASSVGFGVPIDNTTGTATLVSTNVWNISSQEITDNQVLAQFGRKPNKGTNIRKFFKNNKMVLGYWFKKLSFRKQITLNKFVKKYPEGTYYVRISRHVFVVKDGVAIDMVRPKTYCRITDAWEVISPQDLVKY